MTTALAGIVRVVYQGDKFKRDYLVGEVTPVIRCEPHEYGQIHYKLTELLARVASAQVDARDAIGTASKPEQKALWKAVHDAERKLIDYIDEKRVYIGGSDAWRELTKAYDRFVQYG